MPFCRGAKPNGMTVIDGDWDIGRMILERQKDAGWGAKVIDRLAADLREASPT